MLLVLLVLLRVFLIRNHHGSARVDQDGDEARLAGSCEGQTTNVGTGFKVLPVQRNLTGLAVGEADRIRRHGGVALIGAQDRGINSCLGGLVVGARVQVGVDVVVACCRVGHGQGFTC
ncbi:hypothetical protein D3C73_1034470 [compost metagenome]